MGRDALLEKVVSWTCTTPPGDNWDLYHASQPCQSLCTTPSSDDVKMGERIYNSKKIISSIIPYS
jgi:hypothetical protein